MSLGIYAFILIITCFFSSLSMWSFGNALPVIGPQINDVTSQISYANMIAFVSSMMCLIVVMWFVAHLTSMDL